MENSPRADVCSSSSSGNRFHPCTLIGRLRLGKKRGGMKMKIRSRKQYEKYDRKMLQYYIYIVAESCQHWDANILIKIHSSLSLSFFFFLQRWRDPRLESRRDSGRDTARSFMGGFLILLARLRAAKSRIYTITHSNSSIRVYLERSLTWILI